MQPCRPPLSPRATPPGSFASPRAALAAVLLCLACSIATPGLAQNAAVLEELGLEVLASGLDSPISLASSGLSGDGRLFLVLQGGQVLVWDGEAVLDRPFLDIRDRVVVDAKERGLLSIAFHPLYADNGLFFVHYTDLVGDTVLERYRVSVGDPDVADALSGEVVLTLEQPTPTHNGGQLHFGPDDHLYMALGDGNSANDPDCNAQSPDTLLGKILRLDGSALAGAPEAVAPADNPFLGDDPRPDLAWVYGLRNPWRFSFDRATGDLWIGDVGQGRREEVDLLPAGSGGGTNFGWDVMEGSLCGAAPEGCPAGTPPCNDPSLTLPVLEYVNEGTTGGDCAVIGGYVYRGAAIPDLDGIYLFGDFCTGRVRAGVPRLGGSAGGGFELVETPLAAPSTASFGEDVDGELYLVTRSGTLQRVTGPDGPVGPCVPGPTTLCLADGRFRVEAGFRPADAVLQGRAVRLTSDTGYFWAFDEANVEVVVKVIDACGPFDRFWVFAGGLTDVGVELRVTDTERDETAVYENPRRTPFQPIQDTDAFATCP